MSNLSVDRNKVKIRHLLGIQHQFEDYPTDEDFLYDLVKVLHDQHFTEKKWHASHVFPELAPLPKGHSFAKMIDKLASKGYLERIKSNKLYHKLKKHPWQHDITTA